MDGGFILLVILPPALVAGVVAIRGCLTTMKPLFSAKVRRRTADNGSVLTAANGGRCNAFEVALTTLLPEESDSQRAELEVTGPRQVMRGGHVGCGHSVALEGAGAFAEQMRDAGWMIRVRGRKRRGGSTFRQQVLVLDETPRSNM